MLNTINSVLELAKLESGVRDIDKHTVQLDRVPTWAAETFSSEAEANDLSLEVQRLDRPVTVRGNRSVINRIVRHLVENAIKFTPAGGTVTIRTRKDRREGILEVEDTGTGMDPSDVSEVFAPFRQVSEGVDRTYSGLGLGLTIVEKLIHELAGEIHVETEKGMGSCFSVRLPRESS